MLTKVRIWTCALITTILACTIIAVLDISSKSADDKAIQSGVEAFLAGVPSSEAPTSGRKQWLQGWNSERARQELEAKVAEATRAAMLESKKRAEEESRQRRIKQEMYERAFESLIDGDEKAFRELPDSTKRDFIETYLIALERAHSDSRTKSKADAIQSAYYSFRSGIERAGYLPELLSIYDELRQSRRLYR